MNVEAGHCNGNSCVLRQVMTLKRMTYSGHESLLVLCKYEFRSIKQRRIRNEAVVRKSESTGKS